MREKIKEIGFKCGFDIIGISDLSRIHSFDEYINRFYNSGYNGKFCALNPSDLTDYKKQLENVKSVISFGISYNFEYDEELDNGMALIARFARGEDYHEYLREIGDKFMEEVNKIYPMNYKINVDTGVLSDRHFAYLAGLGFCGDNSMFINEKYGSFLNLGHILVDKYIPSDTPLENTKCMGCGLCEKMCPNSAIKGGMIDVKRCISYITQTRISDNDTRGYIYGCDICQKCCPYNKNAIKSKHTRLKGDKDFYMVDLKKESDITKEEFYKKYARSAMGWIGFKRYKRNIKDMMNLYEDKS